MKNLYVKVVLCAQNGTVPKDKHKDDNRNGIPHKKTAL